MRDPWRKQELMSKKLVLEEDEYVEALERIIERDFFPDLPALRDQNQRLQGSLTGSVARSVAGTEATTARRASDADTLQPASVARTESSSWDQPTPTRQPALARVDDEGDSRLIESRQEDAKSTSEMTLNRFVATHTSEDNAAFTELQAKAVEDHKRKYYWAYDANESKGDAKLHLLTNGEWISKDQRRIVDEVLAPKGPMDDRLSAPETWPYRARNALLFPPDLEASRQVCKVESQEVNVLLLEKGQAVSADAHAGILSLRRGNPTRGKRETVYANSRFKADADNDLEATNAKAAGVASHKSELGLVQMTPLIAPGVDASPLMTWGDIEGTPMALDARATPERSLGGPSFQVKESSTREKIAGRLEAEARMRKSQSRQKTPTPLISHGKRVSRDFPTPSRATSIRSRLSSVRSVQRTPLFGSDSELRASYATPLLPPRHSKSAPRKK